MPRRVSACLGVRDPPTDHLAAWLDWHIRVLGMHHIWLHDDHSQTSNVRAAVASHRVRVTLLEASPWTWRDETDLGFNEGLRAHFVGQTDFLQRCLWSASRAAEHALKLGEVEEHWLANLDLDEFLMPSDAHHGLPWAMQAAAAGDDPCVSIRRHNFYAVNVSVNDSATTPAPLRVRTWRAPFPPSPRSQQQSQQPFLPKWLVRLPAPPELVVNMHEAWLASDCNRRCAAVASGSDAFATFDDPAGLAHLLHPVHGATGPVAGPRLVAALLSPLALQCGLMERSRCVLSARAVSLPTDGALRAALLRCLLSGGHGEDGAGFDHELRVGWAPKAMLNGTPLRSTEPPSVHAPWCWRNPCAHGAIPERHLRINHYGHAPLPEQQYRFDMSWGDAVEDQVALVHLSRIAKNSSRAEDPVRAF